MTEPQGEVFDLGYRSYEGPREGRMRPRIAIWTNGVRTALGIGRGWGPKVLPAFLFLAIIVPAVITAVAASLIGLEGDLLDHDDYYQSISIILVLFSAIIAPELLCPDRRDGVISLYLVRPLTTTDYLAGRWLAFFSVTLTLVLLGQAVLFIGFVLSAEQPFDYMQDNWRDVPRFLLAGLVLATFTTTIPLAVSGFTVRRAYAASFVIGLFILSFSVAGILSLCEEEQPPGREADDAVVSEPCDPATGDAAKWFALIAIGEVPSHVNDMIFSGENVSSDFAVLVDELPDAVPVAWYLVLITGPAIALWWRCRRLEQ